MPRRAARLPQPVVRLVPAPADRLDHVLQQPDVGGRRRADLAERAQQVGDRAEHVQLDLPVGRVADPHGARPGVPGQRLDHGLRPQFVAVEVVERVQPFRVAAGVLHHPQHPAHQRLGLLVRAEVDQRPGGERRVARPAVAVVPVADPAQLLGQRGGRRGHEPAARLVPETAQRQRAAQHRVAGA